MSAFTQKYAIIAPIEHIAEGQEFTSTSWPLHTTVADTFAIDRVDDDLITQLQSTVSGRGVVVSAKALSHFGKHNEIEVMLLRDSAALLSLHNDVVDLLLQKSAVFNDPQYLKAGFIGHVTQQVSRRMSPDEQVTFESLAIIDMFPEEDPNNRRVMKVINF